MRDIHAGITLYNPVLFIRFWLGVNDEYFGNWRHQVFRYPYIERTSEASMKSIPMNIDHLDYQMGYIRSEEAGKFMAFLVDKDIRGAVNGSSKGTISIREIIEYVEKKTGIKAVTDITGENAPYNGEPEYSINTEKAESLGFRFSTLQDWIYELLDYYIDSVT